MPELYVSPVATAEAAVPAAMASPAAAAAAQPPALDLSSAVCLQRQPQGAAAEKLPNGAEHAHVASGVGPALAGDNPAATTSALHRNRDDGDSDDDDFRSEATSQDAEGFNVLGFVSALVHQTDVGSSREVTPNSMDLYLDFES
jgi:hypothetical protein